MKWKNRLTNYNFWVSIVSAVLLILQSFDVQFDISNFNEITTAVLGLLVVIGIINDPTKSSTNTAKSEENVTADKVNSPQLESIGEKIINEIKNITTEVKEDKTNIEGNFKENNDANTKDDCTEKSEIVNENFKEETLEEGVVNADLTDTKIEENFQIQQGTNLNNGVPINAEDENDFNINKATDKIFVENVDQPLKLEEAELEKNNLGTTDCVMQNEETNLGKREIEEALANELDNSIKICERELHNEDLEKITETNFEKSNEVQTSFNIVN